MGSPTRFELSDDGDRKRETNKNNRYFFIFVHNEVSCRATLKRLAVQTRRGGRPRVGASISVPTVLGRQGRWLGETTSIERSPSNSSVALP